jgi:SAM-dependent methyltransferase
VRLIPEFSDFKRVTSDCRPWTDGGRLGTCHACGTVQTIVDAHWRAECRDIYGAYAIYHQAGGAEQRVFDSDSGASASRSERLLDRLAEVVALPERGRLVDVGCGNGGFLRSFNQRFSGWRLSGSEFDEKHRASIEGIPGVEKFFTEEMTQWPGDFDAISLIHVLEHIELPGAFLGTARTKLKEGALLLIELPSFADNPFELLIADHATHFESDTIRSILIDAQFSPLHVTGEWVPKELSIVARAEAASGLPPPRPATELGAAVRWLQSVRSRALQLARNSECFGLFGTSIAATWLLNELPGQIAFFVDEDPARVGGQHFGLPIFSPATAPQNSDVFVPLPAAISRQVARRLAPTGGHYHEVPPLP